jgi:phenylalanyl-tRNA synthetase beta chain
MLYSRRLLSRFLPKMNEIDDKQFIVACNSIGTEVASIIKHPKLNNLVIGELLSFEKHPDSDHLNICKVKIDQFGTINTIVCGAHNLQANKKVVVALAGAVLHDGREIVYKELRGIMSEGMLCAYRELTPYNQNFISKNDDDGIMLFDNGVVGDKNVAEFL